jgi:multiple sugar transport system ATP-binding protein
VASITAQKITKIYPNGFKAVKQVDLEVADGEFMVLVGPSGCGKTTLLRMIAGLEDISAGELRIGGQLINDVGPRQRDIAMVFQNYALYPHMSVADNIGLSMRLAKVPKDEIKRRVAEAAEILGLTSWLDRKPAQLSGGQRQRVAMGRAIVREPAAFLMDEPLSNLDAKLRVQMRAEVSRIQRRIGVATVYVTHDQIEAMTMGDRVAVMRDGIVQQCADPQTLYDQPSNMFVGAFIGSPSMNLYEAGLSADGDTLTIGSQTIRPPGGLLAVHPQLAGHRNRQLVVGLRPEHLSVAGSEDASTIAGDIDLVEALGSELLIHFSIDARRVQPDQTLEEEEALVASGEGVARIDPHTKVKAGTRQLFAVEIEALHFFDRESGLSI